MVNTAPAQSIQFAATALLKDATVVENPYTLEYPS